MFMNWFRRNQKVLIGILVIIIMIAWGGLSAIRYLLVERARNLPIIAGRPVEEGERYRAFGELEKLQALGALTARNPLGAFIYGGTEAAPERGGRVSNDAVWRFLVLLRAADEAGIQVTQQEIDAWSSKMGGYQDYETRRAITDFAKLEKLYLSVCESAPLSDAELWLAYSYREHAANIRYVEIGPDLFLSQASATPEEVQKFYEDHKRVTPDEERGVVGFLATERVRLEYAIADVDTYRQGLTVSDAEIKEYYEKNKDTEFLLPEEKPKENKEPAQGPEKGTEKEGEKAPAPKPKEGTEAAPKADKPAEAAAPPGGNADRKPDGGGVEPGKAAEGKDEGALEPPTAPAAKPEAEKKPSYRPLEQVAGEIRGKLLMQKATETAGNVMNRMLDDLQEVAGEYVNEPVPLEQMARRHRLVYKRVARADGRELVDAREVEALVPGGPNVALRIFDPKQKLEANTYSFLDTPKGPVVFQVLERREPEPRPFEEVSAEARQAVLRQKTLAHARTVSEKLLEAAQASSLDQAVTELNERLRKLLGPDSEKKEAAKPEQKPVEEGVKAEAKGGAAGEKAAPEVKEGAKAGAAEKDKPKAGPLEVKETTYFPRATDYVIGMQVPRPGLKKKVFEMQTGALAMVVEEGQAPACYVVEKLGEKEAGVEDFQRLRAMRPLIATVSKMPEYARTWMDGLLAKYPQPEQGKRGGGQEPPPEPVDF